MKRELYADLVILGSGAGGLSAAVAAKLGGVQNIIILEKLGFPGGNALVPKAPVSRMTCNMDDPEQAKMYRDFYDPDARFKKITEWTHGMSDAAVVRAVANKEADNVEWLTSLGIHVDGPKPKLPQFLLPWLEAHEVRIICNAAAEEFITKEGRICGVRAVTPEGSLDVMAPNAVIACGGFHGSDEYMRRYFPAYTEDLYNKFGFTSILNTGDGICLAEQIGGDTSAYTAFETKNASNVSAIEAALNPHQRPDVIWLNRHGQRYVSETDECARNAQLHQPDKESFVVFDSACFSRMLERPDGARLSRAFSELIERGHVAKCETVGDLCTHIGCCKENVENSINMYNSFCDIGHDLQFGKAARGLVRLEVAPYYCVPVKLGIICTHGPLRVDDKMRLLNKAHRPIEGVYVAGLDIGSIDVGVYCAGCSGHSLGWSISSGRIAGEDIASRFTN